MHLLVYVSNYIVPFLILSIVVYGLFEKVNVYETFIKGAKSGFFTVIRIMPTLIGLMAAVGILRASGFLDFIAALIGNFTDLIGFPGELVPLSIVKMFSSSAASGLLVDLYKTYGTDSRIGLIASLYRNHFLHYECLLYDCQDPPYPLYASRSCFCNLCRTRRQRPARRLLFLIFMIHNSQHRSINNTSIQNQNPSKTIVYIFPLC